MLREDRGVGLLAQELVVLFHLGDMLRAYFDDILREPLPERMIALVAALETAEAAAPKA